MQVGGVESNKKVQSMKSPLAVSAFTTAGSNTPVAVDISLLHKIRNQWGDGDNNEEAVCGMDEENAIRPMKRKLEETETADDVQDNPFRNASTNQPIIVSQRSLKKAKEQLTHARPSPAPKGQFRSPVVPRAFVSPATPSTPRAFLPLRTRAVPFSSPSLAPSPSLIRPPSSLAPSPSFIRPPSSLAPSPSFIRPPSSPAPSPSIPPTPFSCLSPLSRSFLLVGRVSERAGRVISNGVRRVFHFTLTDSAGTSLPIEAIGTAADDIEKRVHYSKEYAIRGGRLAPNGRLLIGNPSIVEERTESTVSRVTPPSAFDASRRGGNVAGVVGAVQGSVIWLVDGRRWTSVLVDGGDRMGLEKGDVVVLYALERTVRGPAYYKYGEGSRILINPISDDAEVARLTDWVELGEGASDQTRPCSIAGIPDHGEALVKAYVMDVDSEQPIVCASCCASAACACDGARILGFRVDLVDCVATCSAWMEGEVAEQFVGLTTSDADRLRRFQPDEWRRRVRAAFFEPRVFLLSIGDRIVITRMGAVSFPQFVSFLSR